jgi:hypothetical protein
MHHDTRLRNLNSTETVLAGSLEWTVDKKVDFDKKLVDDEGSRGLGCEGRGVNRITIKRNRSNHSMLLLDCYTI